MRSPWKIAIVLAIAGAAAGTLALKAHDSGKKAASMRETVATSGQASKAGQTGLVSEARETNKALPRLVDLGSDKCSICKMMAPIIEELKEEYTGKFEVQFIDVWKNPDAAKEYRIQMIPTQIFYDPSGQEFFRHTGFIGKEDILAKWRELGINLAVE